MRSRVLFLALLAVLVCGAPGAAGRSSRAALIDCACYDLFQINAEGTGDHLLSRGGSRDLIDMSPDLTRIVFQHRVGVLEVSTLRGSATRTVAGALGAQMGGARFSPNGKLVAYAVGATACEGAYSIHVVSLDGSDDQTLVAGCAASGGLAWSPDGRLLEYLWWRLAASRPASRSSPAAAPITMSSTRGPQTATGRASAGRRTGGGSFTAPGPAMVTSTGWRSGRRALTAATAGACSPASKTKSSGRSTGGATARASSTPATSRSGSHPTTRRRPATHRFGLRLAPMLVLLVAAAGCYGQTPKTPPMPGTVAPNREDRAIVLVQGSPAGRAFGFFPSHPGAEPCVIQGGGP